MYLKKWGGVGWWWVSSRSGWLLELLTELTNCKVLNIKYQSYDLILPVFAVTSIILSANKLTDRNHREEDKEVS